jgi:hypothetical protein
MTTLSLSLSSIGKVGCCAACVRVHMIMHVIVISAQDDYFECAFELHWKGRFVCCLCACEYLLFLPGTIFSYILFHTNIFLPSGVAPTT